MYWNLPVAYPVPLSYFNKTQISAINFQKYFQISKLHAEFYADGRTDGHDEASSGLLQFCERAKNSVFWIATWLPNAISAVWTACQLCGLAFTSVNELVCICSCCVFAMTYPTMSCISCIKMPVCAYCFLVRPALLTYQLTL